MAADNPNALSDIPCNLKISTDWGITKLDVGAISATIAQIDLSNVTEFNADNRGTLKSFVDVITNVTANLFEVHDTELLDTICTGTRTIVPWTLVPNASQTVTSGNWIYNKFIKIENQNGNGSAIVVNSITATTDGLLVADTDYYIGTNASGDYGVFVIDSATVTTEAQDLVIDYNYTPSASSTFSYVNGTTKVKELYVELESIRPDGTIWERIFFCDSMRYTWVIDLAFPDVVEQNALPTSAASFVSNKGSNTKYSTDLL